VKIAEGKERKFLHVLNEKGTYHAYHRNMTSGEGKLRPAGYSGQMGTCELKHHEIQAYGATTGT